MSEWHAMGSDLIYTDSFTPIQLPENALKEYCIHILCEAGNGQFSIQDQSFTFTQNDLVICPAGIALSDLLLSPDFKARIIWVSDKFLDENSPDNQLGIAGYLELIKNPVIHLSDANHAVCSEYFQLMNERLSRTSHAFIRELMRCLIHAFIYDLWNIYYSDTIPVETNLHGATLFERFLFLFRKHCITHR